MGQFRDDVQGRRQQVEVADVLDIRGIALQRLAKVEAGLVVLVQRVDEQLRQCEAVPVEEQPLLLAQHRDRQADLRIHVDQQHLAPELSGEELAQDNGAGGLADPAFHIQQGYHVRHRR